MSAHLGARVEIKSNSKGGGKLVIEYSNNDHLEETLVDSEKALNQGLARDMQTRKI